MGKTEDFPSWPRCSVVWREEKDFNARMDWVLMIPEWIWVRSLRNLSTWVEAQPSISRTRSGFRRRFELVKTNLELRRRHLNAPISGRSNLAQRISFWVLFVVVKQRSFMWNLRNRRIERLQRKLRRTRWFTLQPLEMFTFETFAPTCTAWHLLVFDDASCLIFETRRAGHSALNTIASISTEKRWRNVVTAHCSSLGMLQLISLRNSPVLTARWCAATGTIPILHGKRRNRCSEVLRWNF